MEVIIIAIALECHLLVVIEIIGIVGLEMIE
jgi:hypothetical protein